LGKNKENGGRQQGAVHRQPDQHGDKTRARQAEIAHTGKGVEEKKGPKYDPAKIAAHSDPGRDRLFEDREQHDEAEKNSEKTRFARDVERHHHDRFDPHLKRSVESIANRKS
jgi:hypothetical protein